MAEVRAQAGGAVAGLSGRQPLNNQHIGSPFSEFLDEEGLREEVEFFAIRQVLAWQTRQEVQVRECDSRSDEDQPHPG